MARKKKNKKELEPIVSPADSEAGRSGVFAEDLGRQVRVMAEMITDFRRHFDATLDKKLDEKLKPIRTELTVVRLAVLTHTGQFEKLETRLGVVETKVDKLEQKVDKLEQKVDKLDTRLGAVEGQLETINEKLDTSLALEGRVTQLETKVG